jgi:hypothetical protein
MYSRVFGKYQRGFCVKSNGHDENSHVRKLYGGNVTRGNSWNKCRA